MTIAFISVSLLCLILIVNQLRIYLNRTRAKQTLHSLPELSPEQLIAEMMMRDQWLVAGLKQSLDELNGLQWQIGVADFRQQLGAGIRKVHQAVDEPLPFVLKTAGLVEALSSYVRRLEAKNPALEVDLASSEAQRLSTTREWTLYHMLTTLLQHSLSKAEDLRCYLNIHLGFSDDYLALSYQDETSPLPDLSQDDEVATTLRFWLYLLQQSPMIQSEHEWIFRVPTSSATTPYQRMGVG